MSATSFELEQLRRIPRVKARLSQGIVEGIVGILDSAAVVVTGLVVALLYGRESFSADRPEVVAIVLFVLLMVLGLRVTGAYSFVTVMRPGRQAASIVVVCGLVFLTLLTLAFALKISAEFSRVWAFTWLISATCLILLQRGLIAVALRNLSAAGRLGRKIVIYGAGVHCERMIHRIERLDEPWNHIVGVFDDRVSRSGQAVGRYPVLGNLGDLIDWARRDRPDEVLIALPWGAEERLLTVLQTLAVLPVNVRLCSEFLRMDLIHGRVNSQFGFPVLSVYEPVSGWARVWKRVFDVAVSSAVIVVSLPLLLLIALAIKMESPGPLFFKQKRFGFNNKLIEVYKFRTMNAISSDLLGERLTERNDPRVTKVGAILRRLSLDELPQSINVLKGEMSVVGPRPHAIRTTAGGRQCDEVVDQYATRHKVKPGITGWAQVNGWRGTMEDEEHLIRRLEHDLHYINNWSPWFDMKIMARTVLVVFTGRNSY